VQTIENTKRIRIHDKRDHQIFRWTSLFTLGNNIGESLNAIDQVSEVEVRMFIALNGITVANSNS